jgi:hypothetical protein
MKWTGLALALVIFATAGADAGIFSRKKPPEEEVPGGHPRPRLVAPNGVVVPAWASKRMLESPVPLYGKSWGRRPWPLPLSTQATPSATYARADQLGFGAGPIPGYTNGPNLGGNYPVANVGPGNGNVNGWVPRYGFRNLFSARPLGPPTYPFNTAITGY